MPPESWDCRRRGARSPSTRPSATKSERARLAEVEEWANRRGEVVVIASGHPAPRSSLREHIARWEAQGLRLVPVSELAR